MNRGGFLWSGLATLLGSAQAVAEKRSPSKPEIPMGAHKPPSGGSGVGVFVGASPPGSPADGQLWWDTDDTTPIGGSPLTDAIYLECNTSPVNNGSAVWDTIYDRRGFPNTLASIPASFGLSLTGGGGTVSVDEDGKWHVEVMCNQNADATAKGRITLVVTGDYTGGPSFPLPDLSASMPLLEACMVVLADLVAGDSFALTGGASAATDPDYKIISYAILKIVRLA